MRNRTCLFVVLIVVFLALVVQGCAPSASGRVYSRDQARQSQQTSYGTVIQVDQVTIEGTQSGLGTIAGGALGAGVGQAIGSGTGRALAAIAGGVAGAVAGSAAEKGATTKTGLEIMVELDNGQMVTVVQEADEIYRPGDRVRLLQAADGTARVRH